MEQITLSILTLLALYVLYSECIKIPSFIKKNKTIFYLLIVGFYLYSNNVEGFELDENSWKIIGYIGIFILGFIFGLYIGAEYVTKRR